MRKEIFRLAMPAILSSLLQRAVGIIDVFLVGGLGANALAAVGIGQLLVFMSLSLIWGLSSGTTVTIAQLWGRGRREEAGKIAFQSIILGIILSAGITLLGWLVGLRIMTFLGAAPSVVKLATPYIRIIFLVFGFTALVNILSNIMYGIGDTKTPLVSVILINILHILIAYPLIYGTWGLPQMGVNGAAIAVGVSESIGVLILIFSLRSRGMFHISSFQFQKLRNVIRIGLPIFGDRALQQAAQAFYLKIIMGYGTAAYAAHQVGMAIEAFSFMPGYGISIAATTAVGQSLGANRLDRANLATWEANRFAVFLMTIMGIIFFFFPYLLLRLFTDDPEVIRLGTLFLKIVSILQIPLAITMVVSGSLKGAGDTKFLLLTTIVGSWFVRVPLAYLCGHILGLGLPFVWGAMVVDWTVRMTILLLRYRSERWTQWVLPKSEAVRE